MAVETRSCHACCIGHARERNPHHEFSCQSDQRIKPGKHICADCAGLYHGLRHCKDAELCPWRHHYDRRVRDSGIGEHAGTAGMGGNSHRSRMLYCAGRPDRAGRVQAAAEIGAVVGADYRHRRELPAAKRCAADFRLRPAELPHQNHFHSGCRAGRADHQGRIDCHAGGHDGHHDRAEPVHQQNENRQGDARGIGG